MGGREHLRCAVGNISTTGRWAGSQPRCRGKAGQLPCGRYRLPKDKAVQSLALDHCRFSQGSHIPSGLQNRALEEGPQPEIHPRGRLSHLPGTK